MINLFRENGKKIGYLVIVAIFMVLGAVFAYYIEIHPIAAFGLLAAAFAVVIFNSSWRQLAVYFIFFFLTILNFSLFVNDEKLRTGELYKVNAFVNGNALDIKEINGKYPKEKMVIFLKENYLKNGNYILKIKIENEKNGYYNASIEEALSERGNIIRNKIREVIEEISYRYSEELYGFMKAAVLGESDYVAKERNDTFKYTGTAHVIVISGGHIAVIAGLIMFGANLLLVPYRVRYILVAVILSLYMFVLGWNESIVRAYIMGMVYILGRIFFERTDLKKAMAFSVIITLLINPAAIFSISFQLSYGAIGGLIFIYPLFKSERDNILLELLKGSIAVQVILIPIFMYHFGQLPFLSFLSNIVAVPLGGIIIQAMFIILCVGAIFPASTVAGGYLLDLLIKLFYFYIDIGAVIPLLTLDLNKYITIISVLLYFSFILSSVFYIRNRERKEIIYIVALLMFFSFFIERENTKESYTVGNSFAETKNRETILIVNDNLAEREVRKFKTAGIYNSDYIFYKENTNIAELKKYYKESIFIVLKNGEAAKTENHTVENYRGKLEAKNKGE